MPGYDGTGPQGQGPMTGRGLGLCGRGLRRGFGRGLGRGRGFAWRARALPIYQEVELSGDEEKKLLQEELEAMKQEMEEMKKRLKELK